MFIGIDGCRGGWIVARIEKPSRITFTIVQSLFAISLQKTDRVFIDMPIGFAVSSNRTCDSAAAQLLMPHRRSSVFFTPHKEAVYANNYKEACELNARYTGKKISIQTWNICEKIKEVNAWAQHNAINFIVESHPELCFMGLTGTPCLYNKSTEEGVMERLLILDKELPEAVDSIQDFLFTCSSAQVKPDDVIDATVLCYAAASRNAKKIRVKKGEPTIWYVEK